MARNTLEAVFGALGAGLTGYGRSQARRFEEEQTRLDRERQAERDRLADELAVAGLLERGFGGEREQRAQGQQRAQTALQMALQGATAGRGGVAPSMPMPTQVQQMAAQQARPQREAVNIAGRNLSLLETAFERAQRERAQGMEAAAAERQMRRGEMEFESGLRRQEAEARGREDRKTIEMRVRSTGLSPNDRAYQAVLQFSRTPINEMGIERLPSEDEIAEFAQRAKQTAGAIYGDGQTPRQTPTPTQQPTKPPLRAGTSRADRWEELKRAGFTSAQATATVNEEMPR